MNADLRLHMRKNAFQSVRRVEFFSASFLEETVADEKSVQVSDKGTVRSPQSWVGVPFPTGLPVRDPYFQIVLENLEKPFQKPSEHSFIRRNHAVRDFL